jgi:peptidoglycan hydrolase-like protein with peptidoglycan-binding domain
MKGIHKAGILFLVLASLMGVALPNYSQAQVLTRDQILAQIQSLMQQIAYLQQQIGLLNQGGYYGGYNGYNGYGGYGTCSTFNVNLGIGSSGTDVAALQNILQNEGFSVSYNETSSSYYGASTAAAVRGFQQKYGIRATGFAGPLTRGMLNQLNQNCYNQNYYNQNNQYPYNNNCSQTYPYGNCNCVYPYTNCNNSQSYGTLNVTSPTGGQTYQPGSNVYVSWNYSNYYNYSYPTQNYTVELWNNGAMVTRMTAGSVNFLNFSLPTNLSYGSNYFFKIYDQNNQSISGTSQNFTIGYGVSGSGVTVLGPNGGEQVRINSSYPIQFSVNVSQSSSRARIELWQNGFLLGTITDGLTVFQNQTQTYSWNGGNYNDTNTGMSRTASAGYGYKVKVLVYDSSNQLIGSDDSNSPFNLTF